MGTRGIYGFRKNKKDKTSYNHYDSYPSCLGEQMFDYIKRHSIEEMNGLYDRLMLVDENKKISELTKEEKNGLEILFSYDDKNELIDEDMYSLLHNFQGDLEKYDRYHTVNIMCDNHNFIKDSLFCEYGYIINLDTNELEVFEGFQKKPQKTNRYGCENYRGYYPCKIIKRIKIDDIHNSDKTLEDYLGKHYS